MDQTPGLFFETSELDTIQILGMDEQFNEDQVEFVLNQAGVSIAMDRSLGKKCIFKNENEWIIKPKRGKSMNDIIASLNGALVENKEIIVRPYKVIPPLTIGFNCLVVLELPPTLTSLEFSDILDQFQWETKPLSRVIQPQVALVTFETNVDKNKFLAISPLQLKDPETSETYNCPIVPYSLFLA